MTIIHKPYYHETENADTVILFIHGFMGSPNQFTTLSEAAVGSGYAVSSILLPGHGSNGHEFAKVGKAQWEKAVEDQIKTLSHKYSKIILTGHSMGSLLSLNASTKFRGLIRGIVAIATPMYIRLKLSTIRTSYDVAFGKQHDDDERLKAAYELCSVSRSSLLTYISGTPRYIDLFRIMHDTRKKLELVKIPVLIIHAVDDEVANIRGIKVLERTLKQYEKLVLTESGHYYISKRDSALMTDAFIRFLMETDKK